MNITLNSDTRLSSIRTAYFAGTEENVKRTEPTSNRDEVTISKEGRERLETLADKVEIQLNSMTKEEFMGMVEQWKNENQTKLEVDPYRKVDPDGSIARKIYFESYLGQLECLENTVKSYYADAYEEAVSSPLDSLGFISAKYLCTWSDYYDPNIPTEERQWTYHQLWCILTDSHVALNDPFALASGGGPKTVDELDEIARQTVKDNLDMLMKEYETVIAD